jgi:hypothetical protein
LLLLLRLLLLLLLLLLLPICRLVLHRRRAADATAAGLHRGPVAVEDQRGCHGCCCSCG